VKASVIKPPSLTIEKNRYLGNFDFYFSHRQFRGRTLKLIFAERRLHHGSELLLLKECRNPEFLPLGFQNWH
jgi:hypothetical protein